MVFLGQHSFDLLTETFISTILSLGRKIPYKWPFPFFSKKMVFPVWMRPLLWACLLLHFWWMMEAKKPFSSTATSLKGSSSSVAVGISYHLKGVAMLCRWYMHSFIFKYYTNRILQSGTHFCAWVQFILLTNVCFRKKNGWTKKQWAVHRQVQLSGIKGRIFFP